MQKLIPRFNKILKDTKKLLDLRQNINCHTEKRRHILTSAIIVYRI